MPKILFTSLSTDEKRTIPYQTAIEQSGGTLLWIPADADEQALDDLIASADGILLPGGGDVNPALYGQLAKLYTDDVNYERDTLEMHVLESAIKKNIPTLGICRGLQILNVHCGGTLYQDVEKEMEGAIRHDWHKDKEGSPLPRADIKHLIKISEGSIVYDIVGAKELGVNSLHHQGIHQLGGSLIATAIAPDGLIEAVELSGHPFMLGVQWHPEALYSTPIWKHLFDIFITKAGR